MELTPKISVVMSVHNGYKFLKEAINIILNQTFSDFGFIVINDGSTNDSLNIIQAYNYKRIKLIAYFSNKELIFALNEGLEEAKGKYITRMNSDDISEPERFKKQFNFLELNNNIEVLGDDYIYFLDKHSRQLKSVVNTSEIKVSLVYSFIMCHLPLVNKKSVF